MFHLAMAFFIVGFVAAFFGYAGVASASLDVPRGLFIVCVVGFVVTVGYIASDSRHAPH